MDTLDQIDSTARITRHHRPVGIAGWAATALLIGGETLMQSSGPNKPPFGAPAAEIQRYFETRDPTLHPVGSYLMVLGLLALLWFVCGLSAALRRPATRSEWLPTVMLASGAVAVGAVLLGTGQAAVSRIDEGLDPQLARFAFDLGSITFANVWVAFGSFSIASGWAILATRAEPAWLGWWGPIRWRRTGSGPRGLDHSGVAHPVCAVLAVDPRRLHPDAAKREYRTRALSVTALEQVLGSRLEAFGAEYLEAEGVGEPVGGVERDADRQRVLDLLASDAGG